MLMMAIFLNSSLGAQTFGQIAASTGGTAEVKTLANHHPQWANPANDAGLLPADRSLDNITIVLARSPQQEAAFQQFLTDQQDPASANYHHWLTPAEIAQRFGPSEAQTAAVANWLQSQGLHVGWIAPSRAFIGFGGTAAQIGNAFQTELHSYRVNGLEHISVSSDPILPAALAPSVKSIRGLYTVEDKPLHHARTMSSDSPEVTVSNGAHFLAPGDFAAIYNAPSGGGTGQVIGIVGRSRTDFADFDNFRQKTGANFSNPTEIVPTAFGGVDPGPALTAPPAADISIDDQLEATLDVTRAGSVANVAPLLLVVATEASGGIEADAQYLVQSSPLPAKIMNISFGACESGAGSAGVAYWDSLFQQAAMEGISVFVSSGDSGASGCDTSFAAPPVSPVPNSPNYICSSSYATCVGGTEFNDTADPSQYWSSTNQPNLQSALGYIPEGAWNEPLTATSAPQASASGGGVSSVIPTPAWQTGTGVPTARSGRYTPDIAFSSSGHDGYFACFAAAGASCVDGSNGSYQFEYFFGTSAAAPSMAAITALLDDQLGNAQGNLNPQLYTMAASSPSSFHDVTVASSGVANCQLATPSMCNNSAPSATALTGGQPGYAITAGYDEVTGLGSLDVLNFLANYPAQPTLKVLTSTPGIANFGSVLVGLSVTGQLGLQNSGSSTLNGLTSAVTGPNAGDFPLTTDCPTSLPAGSSCTLSVTFKPSAGGTRTATLTLTSSNAVNSPQTIAISGTGSTTPLTPLISINTSVTAITIAQSLPVEVSVIAPPGSLPFPTGSVVLTSTGYNSGSLPLTDGNAFITIAAGSLVQGNDVLTATYTPDAASASILGSVSGTSLILVTPVSAETFQLVASEVNLQPGATKNNTSDVAVVPVEGWTGTVTLRAAITSSPAGAQNPPTLSFGTTGTVTITNAATEGGTLTITTTTPAAAGSPTQSSLSWYASGAALACLLLFGMPARRRPWQRMLGMLLLLISLAGGVTACGGSKSSSTATPPPPSNPRPASNPGTTAGNYTVTGTSGSTTVTTTFILTVQ
jgi:pseudomonalisin